MRESDHVQAGQVLVELEPYVLLEQLVQARAELDARIAEQEKLNKGFPPEEVARTEQQHLRLAAREELLHKGPPKQQIEAA